MLGRDRQGVVRAAVVRRDALRRMGGWDVAALYAHVGLFPRVVSEALPLPERAPAEPVTAAKILRAFNAPGGAAHEMAEQVAQTAVSTAAQLERSSLVALFGDAGPRAIATLREHAATSLAPWPAAAVTTWAEAARIVLMESVVHLLDALDALGRLPEVPAAGLRETTQLLTELAEPVQFIEAATGRSVRSPLPVLR